MDVRFSRFRQRARGRSVLLLALAAFAFAPPLSAQPLADPAAVLLRERLAAGTPVAGAQLASPRQLGAFYAARSHQPAWSREGAVLPAAGALLQVLRAAEGEGLQGRDYHLARLDALIPRARSEAAAGTLAAATRADLDLLLSDAYLTLGGHLLAGRVEPRRLHPGWTLAPRLADLAARLRDALEAQRIAASLDELRPRAPGYAALREELVRYRALAAGGGWAPLPRGAALRLGDQDVRVAALRRRLALEDAALPAAGDPARFDAALHAAVLRFQRSRGLEVDGVVGPATLAALDVSAAARVRQLELALERLRWLPDDLGRRHIEVIIPAFELVLVEEGRTALAMRVIGGRPDWRTPIFSATMRSVVLSPYWNVPTSIAVQEVLPAVRRDPGYLARHQMKVLSGWDAGAREIDPRSVNWRAMSAGAFPYRFRQEPGPQNPLGAVKFLFPNPHNVYLHDTPSRALFSRAERAFSHGCLRMEQPLALADHLLAGQGTWTPAAIREAIAARRERSVELAQPLPVHIFYRTAWVDAEGTLHFRSDLYGHDRALERALGGVVSAAADGEGEEQGADDCGG